MPSGVWSSFPFDFNPKWPLTRAERVQELEELLSRHYFKTIQKDNIKSAIAYHKGFPPDQVIPDDELVWFQNGKIIDESEIDGEKGTLWDEVSSKDVLSYEIFADQIYYRASVGGYS